MEKIVTKDDCEKTHAIMTRDMAKELKIMKDAITQEIKIALLEHRNGIIDAMNNKLKEKADKSELQIISEKLDDKADKGELFFWRNLIVTSVLIGIFTGVVLMWINR